jgi:hypothetical protein
MAGMASGKFKPDDFSIRLEQITSAPNHIWVSSGYTTVQPQNLTVMGVEEFFSPPFAARKFNLSVDITLDNAVISDKLSYGKGDVGLLYSGGVWYPHKIVRYGTYHHHKEGRTASLGVQSELIPLFGQSGFLEKITFTNRTGRTVNIAVNPAVTAGKPTVIPLNNWQFTPPASKAGDARALTADRWANSEVSVGLYKNNANGTIAPGQSFTTTFTVIVVETRHAASLPAQVDAAGLEQEELTAWQKRLDTYTANVPALKSDIPQLEDYYKRSLVSGLVCLWENPAYAINPFFTTSGMDGGAMCTYLWDNAGYVPNMVSLMLGSDYMKLLSKKMVSIDLEKYFAFTLDGSGVGVRYSYSPLAFTNLISAYFKYFTPDKDLFEYGKNLILNDDERKSKDNLIDYGFQHNLLEMRGAGWEHYTVSPNAERAWCLNQLAEMGKLLGTKSSETDAWQKQAKSISQAVRSELWDNDERWFACIYPDGFRDYVHSIQIFDVLLTDVCTPEMKNALLAELKDGAYLGLCGVSSISKRDTVHYETVDTDWSGAGAYTGEGPQTAMIMYETGQPELGWDILKRHFWMGQHLLYYPQEHYVDRPMAPAHKRANVVAGLSGAETILFGLIGLQPQFDGSLFIEPQLITEGTIHLEGFVYKSNTYNVKVSKSHLSVTRNGKTVYEGMPERVKIS